MARTPYRFTDLQDTPADYVGEALKALIANAGENAVEFGAAAGGGNVVGPVSATDTAIALYNGITGELIKNSLVTVDTSGNIATPGTVDGRDLSVDGTKLDGITAGAEPDQNIGAGAGLTGGGTGDANLDVGAHPDGSIVVNADNVQIGVLASDGQHGSRGGGTQHTTATISAAGFLAAADKIKLDGVAAGAQPDQNIGAGAGLTGGGTGDANLDVGANGDGSITVNPDDIQVGVLATDAQHGARGGGTQHAVATGGTAGFMSGADKAKLDSIVDPGFVTHKDAVRAATAAAGTLASSFENGDTIDGVTLATGDRILIKDQVSAVENGIYIVNASGAPTRASDMDTGDPAGGASLFVQEGTLNAEAGFRCTADGPNDIAGTDALPFSKFTGGSDLSNTDPVNVTKAPASAGVATEAARQDHKHDISTAAPVALAVVVGGSASEGTATTLARSDHTHQVTAPPAPEDVTKSGALTGSALTVARSDHKHDVATAAPVDVGTTNAEGTASSLSRSDHVHDHADQAGGTLHAIATGALAGFLSAADKTKVDGIAAGATNTPLSATAPVDVDKSAAAAGVATEAARQDHKHDIATAAAAEITDATNGEGTATTLSRSDHQHAHGDRGGGTLHAAAVAAGASGFMTGADKSKIDGIAAGATNTPLSSTAPVDVDKSAAAAGVATDAARQDHKHDISTAAPGEISDSTNAEGTATSLSRSDHQHAHGNRGGGLLHAVATTSVAGFLSGADKLKLDGIAAGATAGDADAIHDNVASEISALALVTAASGDHILIEDASDSNNKKRVAASDFLGGGGGGGGEFGEWTQETDGTLFVFLTAGEFSITAGASGTPSGITQFTFHATDNNSVNHQQMMKDFGAGNFLRFTDVATPADYFIFQVQSAAATGGAHATIDVVHMADTGGTFSATKTYGVDTWAATALGAIETIQHSVEVQLPANTTDYITYNTVYGWNHNICDRNLGTSAPGTSLDYTWLAPQGRRAGKLISVIAAGHATDGTGGNIEISICKQAKTDASTSVTNTVILIWNTVAWPLNVHSRKMVTLNPAFHSFGANDHFGFVFRRLGATSPQTLRVNLSYTIAYTS